MKAKHAQLEKKFTTDNQKLTDEYRRITEHFKELQLKFETIERNEVSKFENVWQMKEEIIFAMARKLLEADQVIQEQMLGWSWMPPSEAIFKFEAKNFGSETRSNVDSSTLADSNDNGLDDEVRQYIDSGAYHAALSLICDEAGFLLDEKALRVIDSVPHNEQGYVKAEEVVQALGVRDASAFETLIEAIVASDDASPGEEREGNKHGNEMASIGQSGNLVHPNEVVRRLKAFIESEILPQPSNTMLRSKSKRR